MRHPTRDFQVSPEEPGKPTDVRGHVVQLIFQYGAIGLLLAVIVWQGIRVLNTFIPIFIERFKDDAKAQQTNTIALQQIAGAMVDIRTEIKKGNETCAGAVSVSCARKR